jgi:hypothetical protein
VGITFEPIIIGISDWHQNGQVILDLGAMTFPSAGGQTYLDQGHFSKSVNSCPILLKLCISHTRRSMYNIETICMDIFISRKM